MESRAAKLCGVVLLASAGGCSLVLGFDQDYHPLSNDGDVQGSMVSTFLLPGGGTETVGTDLSQGHVLQALSPKPGGGFSVVDGEGSADGTFVFHGVPAGPYYLRHGSTYHWLSGRAPRFDDPRIGRPDVKAVTQTTTVTVTLNGLAPWVSGDEVALISFSANAVAPHVGSIATPAGSTTFQDSVDWTTAYEPNLLVPTDQVQAIQLVTQSSMAGDYLAASRFVSVTAPAMTDGQPLEIKGTVAPPPSPEQITFDWDLSTLESYAPQVHPSAVVESHAFTVLAQPVFDLGLINPAALAQLTPPVGSASIYGLTLTYANPGYQEACSRTTWFHVAYQLPGSTSPAIVSTYMERDDSKDAFEHESYLVTLSPPAMPQIDGSSLFADQSIASATPTLTWTPPAKGHADFYRVAIVHLYHDAAGATRKEPGGVAFLVTDGTSLTIPPGVLVPGEVYVLMLFASMVPGIDYQNAPYGGGLAGATAGVLSGMITVPANN